MYAVSFSRTEQIPVSAGSGLVSMPAPSFLLVVSAKTDILRGLVTAKFARHGIALNESAIGDVIMRVSQKKITVPFAVQPAFASTSGYFLLGSTPEIVADALLAYRHKNGLISRPEFKSAFQGLSMVNNGIIYISPDMGRFFGKMRDFKIEQHISEMRKHPAFYRIMKQIMSYDGKTEEAAFVIHNWKNGVMIMGNSSIGGQDAAMRMLAKAASHPIPIFKGCPKKHGIYRRLFHSSRKADKAIPEK
jgi:hypothetical protein